MCIQWSVQCSCYDQCSNQQLPLNKGGLFEGPQTRPCDLNMCRRLHGPMSMRSRSHGMCQPREHTTYVRHCPTRLSSFGVGHSGAVQHAYVHREVKISSATHPEQYFHWTRFTVCICISQ